MSGRDQDPDLTDTPEGVPAATEDMRTYDAVLPKGMGTFFGRIRASDLRANEKADSRVDAVQEREVKGLHRTIRFQWLLIALLVAAVLVLAGHAVGIEIPGVGSFSGGQVESEP